MSLYKLTGVDELETIGRRSKAEKKAKRTSKKAARQTKHSTKKAVRQTKKAARKETHKAKAARRKEIRKEKGGALRFVKKIGAAPARTAFLGIVRLNAFKIATKLAQAIQKDPQKVQNFWKRVGGKYDVLKNTVSKASKITLSGYEDAKIASVTLAAAIAAATPVLAMAVALLKSLHLNSDKENQEFDGVLAKGAEDLANDPSLEGTFADMPDDTGSAVMPKNADSSFDEAFSMEPSGATGGGRAASNFNTGSDDFDSGDSRSSELTDEGEPEKDNIMLYLGLGLAAVFLLGRK